MGKGRRAGFSWVFASRRGRWRWESKGGFFWWLGLEGGLVECVVSRWGRIARTMDAWTALDAMLVSLPLSFILSLSLFFCAIHHSGILTDVRSPVCV